MQGEELSISPEEILLDPATGNTTVTIHNNGPSEYAFKLKSTHPSLYIVRPSMGIIGGGRGVKISITLDNSKVEDVHKHKFLFQFSSCTKNLGQEDLQEFFSLPGVEKIDRKLSVGYAGGRSRHTPEHKPDGETNLVVLVAVLFIAYYAAVLAKQMIIG